MLDLFRLPVVDFPKCEPEDLKTATFQAEAVSEAKRCCPLLVCDC